MKADKALWKATGVFAPDYPRQSSSVNTVQSRRYDRTDFNQALKSARDSNMPGYYSVYSFPRGHSGEGNIPKVDCIFIDLDVANGDYEPDGENTSLGAWRRDMSALLARARMIASAIIEEGQQNHFRVTLSGHKGLHLYLDFPSVSPNNGDFGQFKNGLKQYGEQVMSWLDSTAGGINIGPWVDVDASDLGRLARHPNTIHHGAKYDDETRWCVPITVEELADLKVDDYLDLTSGPRWPDGYSRSPSESAGNKVVQAIRNASASRVSSGTRGSHHDDGRVEQYDDEANDDIEIADIDFITANKPCIQAFADRDDAFDHGNASHLMEISIIANFVELGVPRDVIHKFFSQIPGYREDYTDEQIDKVVGRGYEEFNCNSIADKAGQFCLGDDCAVYTRNDDIQK